MRNLKSLFGIILGMLLTMPFLTACGDDESIDLGTPKYESISGKYTINNPSSPYKSIELGAGGDYIVTLNNGKHSVNHVFSSPTSIINFTSKKQSYDDTRRSSRDNELLQRAQSDL